jgi:hypothetical protein
LLSHIQGPAQGGKAGGSELPEPNLTKKRPCFKKLARFFSSNQENFVLNATDSFTPYTFGHDKLCTLSDGPTTPLAP